MELSKLCKHSKLLCHVVFVGLEKERQIGHTQPKNNFIEKVLVNPRKVTRRKAGKRSEQSDLITFRLCNFCDWLKKTILMPLTQCRPSCKTCIQLSKEGRSAILFITFDLLFFSGANPQSNELTRGPPELVQHFRLQWGVHISARALLDPKLIWFDYTTRLSQWRGGG